MTKNREIRPGTSLPCGSHFLKGENREKGPVLGRFGGSFWLKNDQKLSFLGLFLRNLSSGIFLRNFSENSEPGNFLLRN